MIGASTLLRLFRLVFREQKTRLQIDWLTHTDERILEYLSTVEQAAPASIARETDRSEEYVSDRCRQLGLRGLLEEVENGPVAYRLSDLGARYLADEVDAEELEELTG